MVGHTHKADLAAARVTVINGGSVGAGGAANLTEHTNIGIARFRTLKPSFQPLAADLVRSIPAPAPPPPAGNGGPDG
jgi:hypothetical protein